jgi:hypothetical protein
MKPRSRKIAVIIGRHFACNICIVRERLAETDNCTSSSTIMSAMSTYTAKGAASIPAKLDDFSRTRTRFPNAGHRRRDSNIVNNNNRLVH